MNDAKKGVHANHILRDMKNYGGGSIPLSTITERYSQECSNEDEYDDEKKNLQEKNIILQNKVDTCMRVVDRITKLYEQELLDKMEKIPVKKKKTKRCKLFR